MNNKEGVTRDGISHPVCIPDQMQGTQKNSRVFFLDMVVETHTIMLCATCLFIILSPVFVMMSDAYPYLITSILKFIIGTGILLLTVCITFTIKVLKNKFSYQSMVAMVCTTANIVYVVILSLFLHFLSRS